jgi:hypothetical protein
MTSKIGARFVVTFMPVPGVNGVRALRWLLKRAKRQYGLVAVDAREEASTPDVSNQIAETFDQLRRNVVARRAARLWPHHDEGGR